MYGSKIRGHSLIIYSKLLGTYFRSEEVSSPSTPTTVGTMEIPAVLCAKGSHPPLSLFQCQMGVKANYANISPTRDFLCQPNVKEEGRCSCSTTYSSSTTWVGCYFKLETPSVVKDVRVSHWNSHSMLKIYHA